MRHAPVDARARACAPARRTKGARRQWPRACACARTARSMQLACTSSFTLELPANLTRAFSSMAADRS